MIVVRGFARPLPPPVVGKKVNVLPASGTVKVRRPGSSSFKVLRAGQQLPVGTTVDVTKGRVTLVAAANKAGGTMQGGFYDGTFKLTQTKGAKPLTTLRLTDKLSCGSGKASSAAAKKGKRRLWGDGKGRFRTSGSFSSATVRGTRWLVEDTCTSTTTRVDAGQRDVRDFERRKNVVVKAGRKYVARRGVNVSTGWVGRVGIGRDQGASRRPSAPALVTWTKCTVWVHNVDPRAGTR